jgi:Tfp pilus assembly protein PilO
MWIDRDEWKVLAALAVIVVAFAIGIWLPARSERAGLHERIEHAENQLAKARASPDLSTWHEAVSTLRRELQGAQRRVPQDDELSRVLRGITNALNERGVRRQEVVTQEIERLDAYNVIPITVNFQGSFMDAYHVMERVEQMPRLIQVEQLHVKKPNDGAEALAVHMELSTFFAHLESTEP